MYGDSQALSSSDDSMPPILLFPSNPSKPKQERTEQQLQQFDLLMESDIANNNNNNNNNSNNNSGLLRFRSAPTCLLANFADEKRLGASDSGFCSDEAINNTCNKDSGCNNRALPVLMNSQLPPQYPRQSGVGGGGGQLGGVGGGGGGYGVGQSKLGLMRQNSSPPGFLTPQNGYTSVRGMGSYRMAEDSGDGDISPSSGRLQSRMNLSSSGVIPSSLGMLSRITEVEMEHGGLDYSKVGNGISGDNLFSGSSGFPFGSWNDSSYFAETFSTSTGIKKEMDNDPNLFLNSENGETINNRPYALSHHLSLPKTPAEMANMEKYIQDAVPCKIRAKRGCATHPRSIAERVRRTRISERMRKLQDLVPNMDKQTNTADMLDLAVEYIKNLQKQYKILSDNRANCKCSASKKVI